MPGNTATPSPPPGSCEPDQGFAAHLTCAIHHWVALGCPTRATLDAADPARPSVLALRGLHAICGVWREGPDRAEALGIWDAGIEAGDASCGFLAARERLDPSANEARGTAIPADSPTGDYGPYWPAAEAGDPMALRLVIGIGLLLARRHGDPRLAGLMASADPDRLAEAAAFCGSIARHAGDRESLDAARVGAARALGEAIGRGGLHARVVEALAAPSSSARDRAIDRGIGEGSPGCMGLRASAMAMRGAHPDRWLAWADAALAAGYPYGLTARHIAIQKGAVRPRDPGEARRTLTTALILGEPHALDLLQRGRKKLRSLIEGDPPAADVGLAIDLCRRSPILVPCLALAGALRGDRTVIFDRLIRGAAEFDALGLGPVVPAAQPPPSAQPAMVEIAGVALRWHAPASRLNIEAPDGAMLSVRIVEGAISGDLRAGPPDPSGIRPVEGQDFGLILEPGVRAVAVFAGGARIEYRAGA